MSNLSNSIGKFKFAFILEIALFLINLIGGLVLTRQITLEYKSILVMCTVLPSLYVAINQSHKTEMIFTQVIFGSKRGVDFALILISHLFFVVVLSISNYEFPYWVAIFLLSTFSAQNSAKLASAYIRKGRTIYSALRLWHVSLVQLLNITYVTLFRDLTPIFLVGAYLGVEILLFMSLHGLLRKDNKIVPQNKRLDKVLPHHSIAVVLGSNFEMVLLYLIAMFSEKSTLALFSVTLSIISPFFVFSAIGVPYMLSRSPSQKTSERPIRLHSFFGLLAIFILTILLIGFIISDLVLIVFGNSYAEISNSANLLLPSGICMVVSRLIDAELRKRFHHLTSFFCNCLSLGGFSYLFASREQIAFDFCEIFFLAALIQIVAFGLCYRLSRIFQS